MFLVFETLFLFFFFFYVAAAALWNLGTFCFGGRGRGIVLFPPPALSLLLR